MTKKHHDFKHEQGFTLLDILIAFVILSLLAFIAYPSYASHLRKAHRNEAKAILMETAQYLERYYTTHHTYEGADVEDLSATSPKGAAASRAKYLIRFVDEPTAISYTLQAVPVNGQETDECGALSLNQLGARAPSLSGCWH